MELNDDMWTLILHHVPLLLSWRVSATCRASRRVLLEARAHVVCLPWPRSLNTLGDLVARFVHLDDVSSFRYEAESWLADEMVGAGGVISRQQMLRQSITASNYTRALCIFVKRRGWRGVANALGPNCLSHAERARNRIREEARWRPPCLTPEVRAYSAACFAERMAKQASRPPRSA